MFALAAFVCFLLALFHVTLGSIDLIVLGLLFISVHLMFGLTLTPWRRGA